MVTGVSMLTFVYHNGPDRIYLPPQLPQALVVPNAGHAGFGAVDTDDVAPATVVAMPGPSLAFLSLHRRNRRSIPSSSPLENYQNEYRKPSSTLRGRLIWVIFTTPNSGDAGSVTGAPKMGVFVTLNADILNWTRCRSPILKVRNRLALNCGAVLRRIFGLRNGSTRSVSGGRCIQMLFEVSNHFSRVGCSS